MKGYKIYLTKSDEVAELLMRAMECRIGKEEIIRVSTGMVNQNEALSSILHEALSSIIHDAQYYYCIVEYAGRQKYEIVFA